MFKVLLATDGSEESLRAADYVIGLGKRMDDAEITVITVVDPRKMPLSLALASGSVATDIAPMPGILPRLEQARVVITEQMEKEGRDDLNRTETRLSALDRSIGRRLERGRPAEAICRVAENEGFDLVVIGSKGKGRVSGMVMGSVCHEVVQKCSVPVMIVRVQERAP